MTGSARWIPVNPPPESVRRKDRVEAIGAEGRLPINDVMFQFFHWYLPDDGTLWRSIAEHASTLADRGITSVWIPPASKGAHGPFDVGYTVYDLFDVGEFDQKGAVRTKYGTRDELKGAVDALHAAGIRVIADMVFNHRCGGDEVEEVTAVIVAEHDRLQSTSEPIRIRPWTRFTFPGRGGVHSAMTWDARHFVAVDCHEDDPGNNRIYLLEGKRFADDVSRELNNYDFLIGSDVDVHHPEVRAELIHHGQWMVDTFGVDGFRIDAAKHLSSQFVRDWLNTLRSHFGDRPLSAVSEYWGHDADELCRYLDAIDGTASVFDVPLHHRFHAASKEGAGFDLRTILDGSLVSVRPDFAVTFVDCHDTQEGCSLQSWVDGWFRPHAYALILLRPAGLPCVFHEDWFGPARPWLDAMLLARATHGHGDVNDNFGHANLIGWMRTGDPEHPGAMVVLLSNGEAGTMRFETGRPGVVFREQTGSVAGDLQTDDEGKADFVCGAGAVAVWCQR